MVKDLTGLSPDEINKVVNADAREWHENNQYRHTREETECWRCISINDVKHNMEKKRNFRGCVCKHAGYVTPICNAFHHPSDLPSFDPELHDIMK